MKSILTARRLNRTLTTPIACVILVAALVPGFPVYPSVGVETLTEPFREFLEKDMGLTGAETQSVVSGQPFAKLLPTRTKEEVALFGVVRIRATQELFIEKFRDIVAFESGSGVQAAGIFHSPPLPGDVAGLQLDTADLKAIAKCKPGNCALKLSDRAMQSLRQQVDWRSPQALEQANEAVRRAVVDYVANYQTSGDTALSVYNDQDKPQSIRDGLHRLLENSSPFFRGNPQLASYLQAYPHGRSAAMEEVFYWQKAEFGLKPVARASHVIIHRTHGESFATYAIASKMLLASHYFRAAVELKQIVPETNAPEAQSFYLTCLNRSLVDGLTGVKGSIIRGTVTRRSRQSLARYLLSIKQKLEAVQRQG